MAKTHYSWVDRATESDPMDWWSEYTLCGLKETEAPVTDKPENVTCHHCIKQLKKENKITPTK